MADIMVVLDGLQDIGYAELDGKTPYDWGKSDAFREIEENCVSGCFSTTPKGFEPDTQTCVLTLLGVEPEDIPAGRSYIEALAMGVPVGKNDLVLRMNFIEVGSGGILKIPTCSAPLDVAEQLKSAVGGIDGHSVTQVGSYKCLQVVKDGGGFMDSMNTFPPHNYAGRPLEELLPSGNELAAFLADITRGQLKHHTPYTVLNWAQSVPSVLPAFASLHSGMTGALISATLAPVGCAAAMGMECPRIPSATGDTDTDLAAKAAAALKLKDTNDFVMLHVGGPDEATHRQNAREKAEFVKKMDAELISPLIAGCANKDRIMLTCDHVALCKTGGHTTESVRFMIYEKGRKLSGDLGEMDGKKAVELLKSV